MAWRFALLGGLATGLALSVAGTRSVPWEPGALGIAVLSVLRPRRDRGAGEAVAWLACLAICALVAGLAVGGARLETIDRNTLRAEPGEAAAIRGAVAAVPRRDEGMVRVRVETAAGRVMVEAPEPIADLPVGAIVRARGRIREPREWERSYLARLGIARVLVSRGIRSTEARRAGVSGVLDRIRDRAEAALGRGTSPGAAALLRGFVLGQDDRIDAGTVEEFKRSGLAHLLAVSGQNVILLATLAVAVLAVLGVGARARLAWILLLIALYVPVAGAGASIQRAGVMGAAGVVAALASRPASRWYSILLAAVATLVLNPRATGDVGWQLSFAAVVGILAGVPRLAPLLAAGRGPIGGAVADGAAVTLAATLATAPLMALHFGTASLVALPANLVALPAVAPVMWLGMLAGAFGQLPWAPVEPLTWTAGVMAGFIAQVAAWFASPHWALAEVELAGWKVIVAVYVVLVALIAVPFRAWARRRGLAGRFAGSRAGGGPRRPALTVAALVGAVGVAVAVLSAGPPVEPPSGLRLRILDVGQGDAILLEPKRGSPVLVDTGSAGAGAGERLAELGVERLAAIVVTHPEEDHSGALAEVLAAVTADRLVVARPTHELLAVAHAAAITPVRVSAGDVLRAGDLRIEVLWPTEARLSAAEGTGGAPGGDPNELSLVLAARWRDFTALLTGDAESELAPYAAPPADLLKVAHHGSEDAGLASLLARARPALAAISAGAGNRFGHPTPETLATLEAANVGVRRTDRDGEIVVETDGREWSVR